ncbi:hypothetical protein NM80_2061 [Neisseria meningitidis NM80]|nr:hypothetical protein NM80_2061 [Neisseria meningitidis NM80]
MVKPSVGIQNKVPHSGFPDAACRHKSIDFCGNRIAFYFDLDFCTLSDIHGKKLFADSGYLTLETCRQDHFVADFQGGKHCLMRFEFLLLRTHDQEVEHHHNQH